jgi:protein-S-isoprenylcysteine O-methyltransferase Ste14
VAHGVLPWAISLLGPWYGWTDVSPTVWNLLGLVPVAVGFMVLLWLTVNGYAHFAQVPERVELNWEPKILMTRGPYAYSRHPMYLTELALWLGFETASECDLRSVSAESGVPHNELMEQWTLPLPAS